MINKFFAVILTVLSLSVIASQAVDCDNAATTLTINYCASKDRNLAKDQLTKYLEASYKHHEANPELVEAIKRSPTRLAGLLGLSLWVCLYAIETRHHWQGSINPL